MSSDVTARRPRLDPFILPTATTGRFVLLVAAALAGSAQVYAWLVERIQSVSGAPATCARDARASAAALLPSSLVDWYSRCIAWTQLQEADVVVAMLAVFAVVTFAIYLVLPAREARGLRSLNVVRNNPALAAAIREIDTVIAEMAPRRSIDVRVDVCSSRGANCAVGRLGRYLVVLDIDLIRRAAEAGCDADGRLNDQRLGAVLRHELSHLRNRDIDLTVLTRAIHWGFLAAVVLPFTIVAVRVPAALLDFSCRLAGLIVLLWLVRASVLRSREHYADVRSVATHRDEAALNETLLDSTGSLAAKRPLYTLNHPNGFDRRTVLSDGLRLFRLSPAVAAATGMLLGLAFPPTVFLADLLLPGHINLPTWICGVLFGLLVASILGGATWRATLHEVATPGQVVRVGPAAVAFTSAAMLGLFLTPELSSAGSWFALLTSSPLLILVIGLPLLAIAYSYLRWMRSCASSWLPLVARPRRVYHLGVLQSAPVLGIWLAAWFRSVDLTVEGSMLNGGPTWTSIGIAIVATTLNPLTILSIAWACAAALFTGQLRPAGTNRRWWRPADQADEPIRVRRTPLISVFVTSVAVIAAYGLAVLPFYPWLRYAIAIQAMQITPTASTLIPILKVLVLPAVIVIAVVMFGHGLIVGGRQRLDYVLASAGGASMLAAIGVTVMMLVHLSASSPMTRSLPMLLSGLSGYGNLSANDRPANPALGLMVLATLLLTFIVALPFAALGSAARAIGPSRRRMRDARRPAWRTIGLLVPFGLVLASVAYLSFAEGDVTVSTAVPVAVNRPVAEQQFAQRWPRNVPLTDACINMIRSLGDPNEDATQPDGLVITLSQAAMNATSSSDRTLQMMGDDVVTSIRLSELQRATLGVSMALQYCAGAVKLDGRA